MPINILEKKNFWFKYLGNPKNFGVEPWVATGAFFRWMKAQEENNRLLIENTTDKPGGDPGEMRKGPICYDKRNLRNFLPYFCSAAENKVYMFWQKNLRNSWPCCQIVTIKVDLILGKKFCLFEFPLIKVFLFIRLINEFCYIFE